MTSEPATPASAIWTSLPVDIIKIDQTFVAKLSAHPGPQSVVTLIIELAHGLGMTVVAEGVETAEQHQVLMTLGADACQGFYFAKPMPAPADPNRRFHPAAEGAASVSLTSTELVDVAWQPATR